MSNLSKLVLAVSLAGCAGSAPSLQSRPGTHPAVVTGEEACRDPAALVLLCGKRACAFYRCRAVGLLENAMPEGVPYDDAPDEEASAQSAPVGQVVLARGVPAGGLGVPVGSPTRFWGPQPLGYEDIEPVFVFHWRQQQPRPHPLPPGLRAEAERRVRLPHVEHHVFPLEEEFRAWLTSKGISPEDWTIRVVAEDYFAIHEGPKGDLWSAAWREFMRAAPQAAAAEVWRHAGELCVRFGLFQMVFDSPRATARPRAGEETVTFVGIDPAVRARVDQALAECAKLASTEVLARRMDGRDPTPRDCREQVGWDANGRPITLAQQLGIEMHKVALACTRKKLGELRPLGFSIEPRYRYDPQTGRATPMSPEEEQDLLQRGLWSELLGTIVPDVVLHAGNPAWIQAFYDFKFPCVDPEEFPKWRKYPTGHPHEEQWQNELYEKALGTPPAPVTPRRGVIRDE